MTFFRRSFLALAALALWTCAAGAARAAETIPPAPDHYFNDYAGLISPQAGQAINAELDQFERATSNQILVVIYPHLPSDSSVEDYAVRTAQAWKVGQKVHSNGAVLFIFSQDRKLFIATGYGLEGALPDALCKRIIDEEITPRFRSGDFAGGVQAGVDAIMAASRGEYRGSGATVADEQGGAGAGLGGLIKIGIFVVLIVIWSIARSRQHVVYNGIGRRSMWGGPMIFPGGFGGGGGGFGGGGGGGGGFSGGGGGFGGGGAGGSW